MKITNRKQFKYTIGVDEVGRGPLAGPLAVGAFAAPTGFDWNIFRGARDSKKMSAMEREKCFQQVQKRLRQGKFKYSISFIGSKKIDKVGLTKSIRTAVDNSLKKLKLNPKKCLVLLDGGLRAPKKYLYQETIIKGDDKVKAISLASIVAKVTRDKKMVQLSKIHPNYNFYKHKGYGTAEHRSLIRKFGASPIHRQSFCKNI